MTSDPKHFRLVDRAMLAARLHGYHCAGCGLDFSKNQYVARFRAERTKADVYFCPSCAEKILTAQNSPETPA